MSKKARRLDEIVYLISANCTNEATPDSGYASEAELIAEGKAIRSSIVINYDGAADACDQWADFLNGISYGDQDE